MENIKNNKKIKAALYLRVSTDEQLEGYGLSMQEERLRAYVVSQGNYELKDEYIYKEEGYSGALSIEERPELKRLFIDAEQKKFDLVLVLKLDRFFRNSRLLLNALHQLNSYGVNFSSVTEPFDTSNSYGRFALQMMGANAELERETIKERTQGGRRMAAKSGKWVWGPPPYGYKLDEKTKKLKLVPEEEKWVKKFFEWIANEKLSLSVVQSRANSLKVPCYKSRKRKREELKGYWHKKSIARIISNPIYTGTAYFYRFKRNFKGLTSLIDTSLQYNKDQWIVLKVPPVVSQEMFDKCQQQLLKNREMASRNLKHSYLFNKVVYCGKCGLKLFAGTKLPKKDTHNAHKFYHGVNRSDKWQKAVLSAKRCDYCGDIAESRLEPIWDTIKSLLENPDYMFKKLRRYIERSSVGDDNNAKLSMLDKSLGSLIKKERRLDQVYLESEAIDYDDYKKNRANIKKEKEKIRHEILLLKQKMLQKDEIESKIEALKNLYDKLKEMREEMPYEQKSKMIHRLIKRVTIYKDIKEAEIEMIIHEPVSTVAPYQFVSKNGVTASLCDSRIH